MTQNEFEQRTNMTVTAEEYQKIEKLYMSAGNIDKDTFCKEYKKVASSRIVTELYLQVRMLENQVESLKSDKKQMASDKDELIDFMIEQSEKYSSSELRQRAIELLGAKEYLRRKLERGYNLWELDRKLLVELLSNII